MHRCSIYLIICFLTVLKTNSLHAQYKVLNYPVIGEVSPEFTLYNVNNFSRKKVALSDFKGKWLVLDFWTKHCSSCIAAFPKLNLLQKEFKGIIQFILVGNNEGKYNKGIEELYGKVSKVQDLDLAHAYDATLFERFGVSSTPHVVIIDPHGIVRAITFSHELSKERLNMLLNGKDPGMTVKENVVELKVMEKKMVDPFTGIANASNQEGFAASVMSKWSRSNAFRINTKVKPGKGYVGGPLSMNRLYNLAYLGETDWQPGDSLYGRYWHYPLAEFANTIAQKRELKQMDSYNYGLVLPGMQNSVNVIKKAMQLDLLKYFGYEVVEVERDMPCWFLSIDTQYVSHLKTTNKVYENKTWATGFKLVDASVQDVIMKLWNSNQTMDPLIDLTSTDFKIDLTVTADMMTFESIKSAIALKGIRLSRGKTKMRVLVLRN